MICFFPFTHVTERQRQILSRFFKEVRVLDLGDGNGLPGKEDSDGLSLLPFAISQEKAALLRSKLAEYLSWAQLHKGNERNLKHLLKASPYFKSDTDLTSIKSQIVQGQNKGQNIGLNKDLNKDQAREPNSSENLPDPGLFLKLAQTLDRDNELIASRLQVIDQGKNALLAELKGETEGFELELPSAHTRNEDQGRILPDRRMDAWACLASEAGMFAGDTPVLVTTSPGVFTWLTEEADGVINGLDIDPIKVHENECGNRDEWSRDFNNLFDQISAGSHQTKGETLKGSSECCHLSGQIKVRLFPHGNINKRYEIPGSQLMVCLVGLNS